MFIKNMWNRADFWRWFVGIMMVITGIFVLFNPLASLAALALYIGIVFIIVGVGYIINSFSFELGWELSVGIIDVFIGVILAFNLNFTMAALPAILAVWTLIVGIIQATMSWKNRKYNFLWKSGIIVGILGIVFSLLIFIYPMVGVLTITTIMGFYWIMCGVFSIVEGFYVPQIKISVYDK